MYERRGDISFIARGTIPYFVTSERSERRTKYDIVTRAIKLMLSCMRGEVISVLSLEGRYHILSRVSAANEGQNMIS